MENQTGGGIVMERRKHPKLRTLFDEAKGRLDHVFTTVPTGPAATATTWPCASSTKPTPS